MILNQRFWSVCIAMILLAVGVAGCGGKRMVTGIERPKGTLDLRKPDAEIGQLRLTPDTDSQENKGISISVEYTDEDELESFFDREEVFGKLAGKDPYPEGTMVFYLKLSNESGKQIIVDPSEFVLIDNLNIQYSELSADNISALHESRADLWSFAKTTGDLAPGPYGAPLKFAGKWGEQSGRVLHYLIKQVRLSKGIIHPGVAYDGYVAFPHPHPDAKTFRLLIPNIRTDLDPAGVPQRVIDFEFQFELKNGS